MRPRVLRRFLVCLSLLACLSSQAATNQPVTVRVFHLPDRSTSQGINHGLAEAVQVFRTTHPHIRLESATRLKVEGHEMDTGVLMAIAGGLSPDIIYVNFRQSESYIQQGFLAPLDEYVEAMPKEEFNDRVPESVRPVIHRRGPDGKTHTYMMPYGIVVSALIYRKDVFLEAGLDPDRPPQTWDEFFEYAQKITNPETGMYGTAFIEGPEASYYLFPFLCSAGAKAVTQLPNGEWRASFDTPEAVEAYYFYNKLLTHRWRRDGKPVRGVGCRGTDVGDKWNAGKIGMITSDLYDKQLSDLNPELYAIAPVPGGPDGKSSSAINCMMMGIFSGTKDRRVRDAAWEYMRFIDGPEARRLITQSIVENGNARFVNPTFLVRYGFAELVPLVQRGLFEVYQQAVANGQPEPYGRNCQLVYDYLTKPMDQIAALTDAGKFEGKSETEVKAEIAAILKRAVTETNEKMIGYLPSQKRKTRHAVAWAVVVAVGLSFWFVIRRVMSEFSGTTGVKTTWGFRKYRTAYLVLLPALALILVWQYYPLARGSLMAFQDYKIIGGSRWIGMENFANVLFDAQYWRSFLHSLYFMALWIVFGFVPPIFLAILLQEVPRGKVLFRTLFYLPAVISGVVVMFLWKQFYDQSEQGLLNQLLNVFGLSPQRWLANPRLAMLCIVVPLSWVNLGPGCIIYLAALKSIPDDLYEAAEIDGAGFSRKVFSIVLPFLKPLLVINFIGAFIAAFRSADYVLAMTGGGPGDATNVVGMEIFNTSFLHLKFGLATAMAWILGSLLLGFTALQLRTLSKVEFKTAKA